MADYTNHANFNTVTVQGRVLHSEKVSSKNGEFLAVTLISTCTKDGQDVVYSFNTSNGLMSLADRGYLPNGRQLIVTGHIAEVSEVYTDKNGETRILKNPRIKLSGAQVLDGGLGAQPKSFQKENNIRPVAGTPIRPSQAAIAEATKQAIADAPLDETPELVGAGANLTPKEGF